MRLSRFARLGGALLSCALMLGNNREAVAQRGVPIQDDVNAVDFSRLGLKRGVLLKLPVDVTPGRSMDATLPIDGDCQVLCEPGRALTAEVDVECPTVGVTGATTTSDAARGTPPWSAAR